MTVLAVLVWLLRQKGEFVFEQAPLAVAVSKDGSSSSRVRTLEDQPGEYSYLRVVQAADARVPSALTPWNRLKIKHVVIDPSRL